MSEGDVSLVIEVPFDIEPRRGEARRVAGAPASVRAAYLDALSHEVEAACEDLAGRTVRSVEVRGNAAMLPVDGFARLVRRLRRAGAWDTHGEFVLEMDPATVGTPSLTALNGCRFRTLRLDAFTADEAARSYLGLPPLSSLGVAMAFIEKFGYLRVSMRCIYGAPSLSEHALRSTVELLDETSQVREFVLFAYEGAAADGLSAEEVEGQRRVLEDALRARGFKPYAPERFCRAGGRDGAYLDRACGMDVLGFGAGACSRLDGMEWRNTPDVAAYVAAGGDFERIVCEARQVAAG